MRVVVKKTNVRVILSFAESMKVLSNPRARTELHRGVIDAGRKTKTQVQRAVMKQMALKPGNYNSYVVAGTRGIPRKANLAYDIFGVKGGAKVEKYKDLRSLVSGGRAYKRMNVTRRDIDKGTVMSGVWNKPRIFKRSFTQAGGWYAFRPASAGGSKTAPKIFWTYGLKPGQPRGADGRFSASGKLWGKIRQLYGPALMKEIPQDLSLVTFQKVAPPLLEQHVGKRLNKLLKF